MLQHRGEDLFACPEWLWFQNHWWQASDDSLVEGKGKHDQLLVLVFCEELVSHRQVHSTHDVVLDQAT